MKHNYIIIYILDSDTDYVSANIGSDLGILPSLCYSTVTHLTDKSHRYHYFLPSIPHYNIVSNILHA